ncbi:Protein FAR1-RELATED SEQUENCE 5 [Striga hermonthica]|uniref:Protein FAR1-RELATED SEQUENCE 5 n=1 Tax=Striga hermonthica TaxID=68872 RepID=A0A9N7R417_STRHE|nr:Protein FAR1-RELATED SEQUENCE 5 [Striga hermonthica]
MIVDYGDFGDVITFDTTYGTNKELRPFGVFTGFNHHRQMVIFGGALLYDETADSFAWFFETFLNAHGGKEPQTIFTDQDAAMANALAKVLKNTRHRLCTWHLNQNGIKHLGWCMKDDSSFLTEFKRQFDRVVDEKRERELKADFDARQKVPPLESYDSLLLMQVSQLYTPEIFTLFEIELRAALRKYLRMNMWFVVMVQEKMI